MSDENYKTKNESSNDIDFLHILKEKGHVYRNFLEKIEKPLIEKVLKITRGNKSKAAKILGINRNTLNTKIKKIEIDIKKFKI